ncbi:MAG: CaiB/BaiF CoA transferase family protein [Dehalococcoidales bacterium]
MTKMNNQPILHNIRILDFTWALAGPYTTRLLGDFGAEVIKVQSPLMEAPDDALVRGYYNTWNRNKLGITLNLNKPDGVVLAKRLVGICDAVVENFTPRVMFNWELDYANLKKIKPDIILVNMSVMGQQSLKRNYSGYGLTVHAISGMTGLTSFPRQPPLGPGFSYADHVAGLYASIRLLGALEQRRRMGEGQHIDISEVEVMKNLLDNAKGKELKPLGNSSPIAAPHNVYRCKDDRWCALAVFTEEEWRALKQALGNPPWAEDKKFVTLSQRLENRDELDRLLTAWTQAHTAEEVMFLLQKNGVAAGVVQDAADLANDPQLKARGFFIKNAKTPFIDATPIRMSAAKAEYKKSAPSPGQDNDYVYGELLGISEQEMAVLKEKGVI